MRHRLLAVTLLLLWASNLCLAQSLELVTAGTRKRPLPSALGTARRTGRRCALPTDTGQTDRREEGYEQLGLGRSVERHTGCAVGMETVEGCSAQSHDG